MTRGLLAVSLSVLLAASAAAQPPAPVPASSPAATPVPPPPAFVPSGVTPPPPVVDTAPVALLVDLGSGRTLYARDADRGFLPASVTKTMTAYVAFELMAQGKLSPNQYFTESEDAWRHWHATGSRMFLGRGAPVSVDQLLMGIMTVSANDGCVVLAEGAAGSVANWVALMNATARRLGMSESHFGTPNGWMDGGNTYVSARDLVKLSNAMISRYPAFYHRYVGHPELTWNGITQRNHDPILGVIPGADGIKTGFTNEAHYNFLGSAERGGRRLVMVLAGVPKPWQRAKAARALMEWGFAAWDAHPLYGEGAHVGEAAVQGGAAASVGLAAPRAYFATSPKGSRAPVTLRITYKGPLVAPIAKGAEVAELEVRVGAEPVTRLPLVAETAVPRGGMIDRLRAGLSQLL